ncbi:zinc transporter ZupT [Sulfurimonas marina]|uniref:Zinc transporter ZupT n=1 Tax=Sulfurimonas marina TaxID=2590551 RepID=A0A7M1AUU9_9BACT|nr:zinc transporter ZupT [Sulfurimonas marina]QOP41207.1 zinc transporter ZupT [Sulfurimonas marina]
MEIADTTLFYSAFFLTLLAGLSTGIGATLAFFSHTNNHKFLSVGMGFSAGVMIYVSFGEILIKAQNNFSTIYGEIQGEALTLLAFFGGFALSALIDYLVPDDVNPHELKSDTELKELQQYDNRFQKQALKRTGIFTALAIGIHNFPEGFATFVSALDGLMLGIPIALAIAIHNIPEGMAVSLPIYHATGDKKKAFYYALFSGIAEPVGALLGFFLLLPLMGDITLGVTFGIVAGIMIYISFDELLPAARLYGNAHTTIIGIALGMGVISFSLLLFKVIL